MNLEKNAYLLPLIRRDLEIYRGPISSDGSPTYNIYDPINERYFKITWVEATIFQILKPGMTLSELVKAVNSHTTLTVTSDDVNEFFHLAKKCEFLQEKKSSDQLMEEKEKKKINPLKWLLFHYLYLRIPLLKPDNFLKKTLSYITPLWSPIALIIYAFISFLGILFLIQHFDDYLYTFTYFFNLDGILFYGVAILAVKLIHEFAHAYAACYYGVNVPRMGMAFLVFIPVFFTDVTHGWRLESRKHRFVISAAGLISELTLAGMATFFWGICSPGLIKSIFFVISSTSLITSLLFNLNPALKFDGYYILSDLWGIDNLQNRAFVVTRWKLRQWFLGIYTPEPEANLSSARIRGMVIYSIYTWFYRIFIFVSISLFLYYTLAKFLGLIMLLSTVSMMIIWPILSEIKRLIMLKNFIHKNRRLTITKSVLILLLAWLILPLPHTFTFPGITTPVDEQVFYIPYSSKIEGIYVKRGDEVMKGQLLLKMHSEELDANIRIAEKDREGLNEQIAILTHSENLKDKSSIPSKLEELAAVEEALAGFEAQKQKMEIRSEVKGKVFAWVQDLWEGQSLTADSEVGKVATFGKILIHGYIPEDKILDIELGQSVTFRVKSTLSGYSGTITSIRQVGSEYLFDGYLGSIYGGDLPVTVNENKELTLVDSYYLVEISLEGEAEELRYGEIGWIKARGKWKSYLFSTVSYLRALFWRESGM